MKALRLPLAYISIVFYAEGWRLLFGAKEFSTNEECRAYSEAVLARYERIYGNCPFSLSILEGWR